MKTSPITGSDPALHRMYVAFGYHRFTSRRRGDGWDLDWPDWRDAWLPSWSQRGRGRYDMCMGRIDLEQPWSVTNIHIVTRRQHSQHIRKHYS